MGNTATQVFTSNGTFVCPGGVKRARVVYESLWGSKVSVQFQSILYLDVNGNPYGWGNNQLGQLGIGSTSNVSSPCQVVGNTLSVSSSTVVLSSFLFKQILSVDDSGFGIDGSGNLYSWGLNTQGQLGLGSTSNGNSPSLVVAGTTRFKMVTHALNTAVGITVYMLDYTGKAWAMGYNVKGQMGDGTLITKSTPTVVLGGNTFINIFASRLSYATFAIDNKNQLWGWGENANGEVGNNTTIAVSSPALVVGGRLWKWAASSFTNGVDSVGLTTAGDLYGWGSNTLTSLTTSSPVLIVAGKGFVSAAACNNVGGAFLIALDGNGAAWAFGANTYGGVGTNGASVSSTGTLVVGGISFQSVDISFSGTVYGLDNKNQLWAWGYNTNGQIGDGTTTFRSSPVLVAGSKKWAAFFVDRAGSVGNECVVAVDTDGYFWTWGQGTAGQLGNNATLPVSSPVMVVGNPNPNLVYEKKVYDMDVTPGQSYPVVVTNGLGLFGQRILGEIPSKILVQYDQ